MKYTGKATDTFLRLKIWLPQTLSQLFMLQVEQTTLELLMLVLEFRVNCRLKNTQRNFHWNQWKILNEDA